MRTTPTANASAGDESDGAAVAATHDVPGGRVSDHQTERGIVRTGTADWLLVAAASARQGYEAALAAAAPLDVFGRAIIAPDAARVIADEISTGGGTPTRNLTLALALTLTQTYP